MSTLEKRLRALLDGREMPWAKIVSLLEKFGVAVSPPRGGGSHFRVKFPDGYSLTVPVHNGHIKTIYIEQIADKIAEIARAEK